MSNITPKILGFIAPKIEKDHYIFGQKVPFEILRQDCIWDVPIPYNEKQQRAFETYNCTGFNTGKQIRVYLKIKFGIDFNPSDRWIGIIAGTSAAASGNDPHVVMEAIRIYGLIPESMLPYSDDLKDINEYYSFKGADKAACYAEGKRWLEKFTFLHDWVATPDMPKQTRIDNMKLALQTSPLTIAVYAWATNEMNVYIKLGQENHWTLAGAFPDFIDVSDSYDPFDKIVDQDILYCKRIYIEKKKPVTVPATPVPSSSSPTLPTISEACKTQFQAFLDFILKLINKK